MLIKYGNRVGRFFSAFIAADYILTAFIQSIAVVEDYGLSAILSNIVIFSFVGIVWAKEAYDPQSKFIFRKLPWWRYWPIPLALLAFWFPVGPKGEPDFNPIYLLTSDFGVAFCLTTPVVVTVLSLAYPHVNKRVLTATCYAGLPYGVLNLALGVLIPGAWYVLGVLHIPLFSISLYGLLLPKIATYPPAG